MRRPPTSWLLLAGSIAAADIGLARTGRPLLSHHAWDAVDDPTARPVAVAIWTAVTWHLAVPRRPWRDALAIGLLAGAAARITGVTVTQPS